MMLACRAFCGVLFFVGAAVAASPDFTSGVSLPTLAGPLASATGDFNGDGHADFAVSNTAVASVSIFLGNGDGTFQTRVDYPVSECLVGQIVTGDFNKDGSLDLLGTCTLTPEIFVLPGKGDGTFGSPVITTAPMPVVSGFLENFVEPLTTGDVNGDGIPDLALIIQTSDFLGLDSAGAIGQAVIMTGNGDGTFGHPTTLSIAPAGTEPYAVQLADVNGDGKVDIVGIAFDYTYTGLSNPYTGFFFVALGNGAGGFSLTNSYPLTGVPQTGMLVGDVNGDGKVDVVFAGLSISAIFSGDTNSLSGVGVFLGNGDGGFTQGYTELDSQTVQNQATLGSALSPVLGSSNPDLICVGYYQSLTGDNAITGGLVVRPNNGDGTFGAPENLQTPTADQPFSFSIADFNGDGRPDIVEFNFTESLFNLLLLDPDVLSEIDLIGLTLEMFPAATAEILLNHTGVSPFTNANSASYATGGLASASIVSAFGTNLATSTASAGGLPLPTTLGGTSITVIDSLGVTRAAPIFYASATQINYEIPDGTATGTATVSIAAPSGTVAVQQPVVSVAPGIFNASGMAAAQVFTYPAGASAPIVTSTIGTNSQGQLILTPINLSASDTPVYLILYATGIRNHQSPVTATIGTTAVTTAYAGAQGVYVGEDQINILLPQTLQGSGVVSVSLAADGQTSNAVQIDIQ